MYACSLQLPMYYQRTALSSSWAWPSTNAGSWNGKSTKEAVIRNAMKYAGLLVIWLLCSLSANAQKGIEDGSRFGHGEDSVRCIQHIALYKTYLQKMILPKPTAHGNRYLPKPPGHLPISTPMAPKSCVHWLPIRITKQRKRITWQNWWIYMTSTYNIWIHWTHWPIHRLPPDSSWGWRYTTMSCSRVPTSI